MIITGYAHKYGDNVDTDVIIPARHLHMTDPGELARHCLEDLDPGFAAAVRPGDVIVAGENFGCGSSREHAPLAIKASGAGCVLARSFARIFYRNAVNIGLPILECPAAVDAAASGDILCIDLSLGRVDNATTGRSYRAEPFPGFVMELIRRGGLVPYIRSQARPAGREARP